MTLSIVQSHEKHHQPTSFRVLLPRRFCSPRSLRGREQNRTSGVGGRPHLEANRRADAAVVGAGQEHRAVVGLRHGARWAGGRQPRGKLEGGHRFVGVLHVSSRVKSSFNPYPRHVNVRN